MPIVSKTSQSLLHQRGLFDRRTGLQQSGAFRKSQSLLHQRGLFDLTGGQFGTAGSQKGLNRFFISADSLTVFCYRKEEQKNREGLNRFFISADSLTSQLDPRHPQALSSQSLLHQRGLFDFYLNPLSISCALSQSLLHQRGLFDYGAVIFCCGIGYSILSQSLLHQRGLFDSGLGGLIEQAE